jgi:hypothetical protein
MPFAEHPAITPPADAFTVWRYMDFMKFVALLEDQALYFPCLSTFTDPMEGFLTRPTFKRLAVFGHDATTDEERAVGRNNVEAFRQARNLMYVSSWHMNEHESTAMWGMYLKSNEGLAIRTTIAGLKQAFAPSTQSIHIGSIEYVDYEQDQIPFENVMYLGLHKRRSFEHEREVRAMFLFGGGDGQLVKVDLSALIKAVHVAPSSPEWLLNLVKKLVLRYGLDTEVVHSGLDVRPIY